MNINLSISIVILCTITLLSSVVVLQDHHNKINRIFALLCFSIVAWIASNVFADLSYLGGALFWSKFAIIPPLFLPILFLYLVIELYFKGEEKYKKNIIPFFIITAIVILLAPTSLNIKSITLTQSGVSYVPGVLYYALFSYLAVGFVISFYLLINTFRASKDLEQKKQIKFIFIGTFLTVFFSILANIILPILNYSSANIYGPIMPLFFLVFTAYAIIKHHLFNIKVILAELLTFGVWIAIIVMTTMMDNLNGRILGGFVLAVVVVIGIFLIKSVRKEVALAEDLGVANKGLEVANENLEITNKKLEVSNRDLGIANEKLKGLDKLKSEFLSLASHQLRSPLTAIKGYTSMLVEGSYGKLEEKQNEIVGHVQSIAQSMIGMVEDFLNVSKIEQGGMQYVFVPTDLSKMVATLFEEMKISAESKHLEFALEMDTTDTFTVNADAGKLKQVFLNLVDNSIKYTPSGFVHMSLVQNKEKNTVTFSVKDSGVGVSPETKQKLFQKFNRGEGGKLNTGGSGIGLYLAKEITEAHHGEIVIESEGLGKGASFKVVLPRGKGA